METYTLIVLLLAATIRVATPLLLAAIAGLFSERAGVIDLGLEGKMLGAAFAAAAVSATTGSVWFGLGAGIATAVFLALLIGFDNRLIVMIEWITAWFTFDRGARLITGAPRRAAEDVPPAR